MGYRTGSHTKFKIEYHFVWVTKYRFHVLKGDIALRVRELVRQVCAKHEIEILRGVVSKDHVHLLISVPPKVSMSKLIGTLKGKTGIQVFRQFRYLKNKPYWVNHFWARGYCVDTVGIDEEIIRKYVKFQEKEEQRQTSLKY